MTISKKITDVLKHKVRYIQDTNQSLYLAGPIKLPVNLHGETHIFQWYCWVPSDALPNTTPEQELPIEALVARLSQASLAEMQQSSVLVYGDFEHADDAIIRFHSICHTGDIFGSKRCDCGFQLRQSMQMIVKQGAGALFYLANHEGRGIGLFSKALAYLLQEEGLDTVEANLQLGFSDDSRNYEEAILVLQSLRSNPVTLITNNPRKLQALQQSGANLSGRVPLWGDVSEFNERYLETKVARSGHLRTGSE